MLKPLFGGKKNRRSAEDAPATPEGMKGGIFYIRVSTDKQEEKGNGLESQKEIILDFAKKNDVHQIGDFYVEIGSGGSPLEQRPKLTQAIADAKKHNAYLITSKLDRLSRRASMVCNFLDEGFKFVTVEYGFQAEALFIRILVALAQKEKELIGERTKLGLAQVKKRYEEEYKRDVEQLGPDKAIKKRLGIPSVAKAPTHISHARRAEGYDRAKRYVNIFIEPTIRELKSEGVKNPSRILIAERLNEKKIKTDYDSEWTPSIIYHTLKKIEKGSQPSDSSGDNLLPDAMVPKSNIIKIH